ncbi:MAG: SDR family oxidoreductase [Victivallaceae bacterium]|nr:SDR family oxidoreductase [Victivallaceae bacterium]
MNTETKRVLVTGGAVRIGRAVCLAFAEAGARIVIHCHNSVIPAEKLLAALPGSGHQLQTCDLNSAAETADFLSRCGQIDILINNAAVYRRGDFPDESDSEVSRQMQVNFLAPLSLMKQFAAQELENGCIINFLDQEVAKATETLNSYAVSKRALRDATLIAARRLAPKIRVNAVAPGPVLPPAGLKGPGMRKILGKVPLGGQIPLPDITAACLFLVQNDSLTGQIIYVDGGQHLIQAGT